MESFAGGIEAVGVCVTAVATIVLAYVTYVLAQETKRLAALGQQPEVLVTIEPSPRSVTMFMMHVENTGTASAFDIHLKFEPEIEYWHDFKPFVSLPVLKPRQRVSTLLCRYPQIKGKKFLVTADWTRRPENLDRESLSYMFDADFLSGIATLGDIPEIETAKSLKKIADEFGRISNATNKIGVNIYSRTDREREEREFDQAYVEMMGDATPCPSPTSGEAEAQNGVPATGDDKTSS